MRGGTHVTGSTHRAGPRRACCCRRVVWRASRRVYSAVACRGITECGSKAKRDCCFHGRSCVPAPALGEAPLLADVAHRQRPIEIAARLELFHNRDHRDRVAPAGSTMLVSVRKSSAVYLPGEYAAEYILYGRKIVSYRTRQYKNHVQRPSYESHHPFQCCV